MKTRSIASLLLTTALTFAAAGVASAQDKTVKIGALSDQSGLYADLGGPGSTLAAQMAVEDSGLTAKGWKIDIVSGDHQNKPDIGTAIARQWFDVDKIDVIVDVPNSGVALAVNNVIKEKNGVYINSGAATSDLTNAQCSPNTVHWTYDTYMLAHTTGQALVKAGGDSWFFLTADYAFGAALERDTTAVVTANGGKVVGGVKHPLNTPDFSSFLLQAQASKAKIIGLANAGGDTTNAIKQAAEFGIVKGGQKLAALLLFLTDVKAIGLETAQGLNFTETFYWDMNDQTRAFSKRFASKMKNNAPPTMVQAGVYAGVRHYLKALDALGGNPHDGVKVVEKMKSMPTEDDLFGKGEIQPNGRTIHSAYLFEVKKPSESKGPWDFYKLVGTVPGDQAFTPLSESKCALLKK
ncbi:MULTISPECIES: ABC transporter substrate-binding protein [Bradyrhizobium]|jgi:branched-chain amino acid transport system substrate-binding protein|uniref:ABC transporter substrate-binding protein n=1 Tax=Bradyrhizobium diazoefficiens (strain JCM 10833 / BCRC 13528 / IAM 13628 / NBRC 14792 / USDA 110) TaxID=224911 RepID=Q89N03_BRADU|nr:MULTISPECIES: ABC transporter substrate-binding protein [Bradyrhizobium]MBP1065980.1 branched-chain amino acid transport system substrate-binding protein [Bradyrhizobium japonicum]AND89342.1 ABC transporter permease [Bradyrhizobium diazoefficiens USDA 110]AWO90978.1 ABC transporter substrate-binding protein [Bradyrhizobium diazoefficiens]MBP1093367.1 branched-chain amino acid transport system substrate-binding protein [Bradyrhizobium japonicum]MDA9395382.1 ABC transporter permease [Bradyrhi